MKLPRITKKHITYSLYAFGMILYALIFLLGINNMSETKRNTEAIKQTTSSTNKLVAGQSNILNAIKKVTQDTQLTAQQQTSIIICMLQVPQPERTTDIANDCRKQATVDSSGADIPVGTIPNSAGNNGASSSPQPVPKNTTSQATSSQGNSDKAPQPKPNVIQRVINRVKGIL